MKRTMALIAAEMAEILHAILADPEVGTNVKTGTNTLKGSNLDKSVEVRENITDSPFFTVMINDYYRYVSNGRERHHTPKVPIDALRDWARRKLGRTDNSTLFMVQRSIYEKGIRPRPIFHHFWKEIDKRWEGEWASLLFDELTQDLNKYFNEK